MMEPKICGEHQSTIGCGKGGCSEARIGPGPVRFVGSEQELRRELKFKSLGLASLARVITRQRPGLTFLREGGANTHFSTCKPVTGGHKIGSTCSTAMTLSWLMKRRRLIPFSTILMKS
jgi:hypothetical protein